MLINRIISIPINSLTFILFISFQGRHSTPRSNFIVDMNLIFIVKFVVENLSKLSMFVTNFVDRNASSNITNSINRIIYDKDDNRN